MSAEEKRLDPRMTNDMKQLMDLIDKVEFTPEQLEQLKPIIFVINDKLDKYESGEKMVRPRLPTVVYVLYAFNRDFGTHVYGVYTSHDEAILQREETHCNIAIRRTDEVIPWTE